MLTILSQKISSNKIMLEHTCLYTWAGLCMDLNGIFCRNYHIAQALLFQISTFCCYSCYILLVLSLSLLRSYKMMLICLYAEDLEKLPKHSQKSIDLCDHHYSQLKSCFFLTLLRTFFCYILILV